MFGGRFSSSIGAVGIEVGNRSVRLLQLRRQSNRLIVVGASEEAVATPGAPASVFIPSAASAKDAPQPTPSGQISPLGARLRAAFANGGFTGRRCIVSLPREDICIQSVRLPKMPDHEMEQAAAWEASQRFGFDRAAMEVCVLRTGASLQSGENREEVLLVAASHARIQDRLVPILEAGFRPAAVDTGFGALARLFSQQFRREADRQHVRGVLDVGESGSNIIILRGDQIAFCKPVQIGGDHLNKAVSEHLQMELDAAADLRAVRIAEHGRQSVEKSIDAATDRAVFEAVRPLMGDIVKEVILCLRYYGVTFRGKPPCQIILSGRDGAEPRLAEMLHQASKVPVETDDANGTLADIGEQLRSVMNRDSGPAAAWAIAAGLSIRDLAAARSKSAGETPQTRGAAA